MLEALGVIPVLCKQSPVVPICNPSPGEVEVGGLGV